MTAAINTRLPGIGSSRGPIRWYSPSRKASEPGGVCRRAVGRRFAGVADSDPPRWQLRLPRNSDQPIDVTIRFDLPPTAAPRALARLAVDIPDFSNVYLEQLIWSLELPETEVVLISPRGFSRLFEWRRDGLFWKRKPSNRYIESLRELDFIDAASIDASGSRSQYSYSQYGSATRIELYTIDRSLVVLVGAGVTLIIGFFFWTFPRMRSAATLLLIGFSICLAGLWASEPIQVFLQPAVFGAVMATIATAVDSRARRRSRRPGGESSIRVLPRPASAGASSPSVRRCCVPREAITEYRDDPANSPHGMVAGRADRRPCSAVPAIRPGNGMEPESGIVDPTDTCGCHGP